MGVFLMNNIKEQYELWCKNATDDIDLVNELKAMQNDPDAVSDAFYKSLEFGTAGLRGVIGAGTNRMNVYTVGKASQGLAAYVNSITENGSIAIAYDSRIKSDVFARAAAEIFAANGIKAYIYRELMPTPMLSYAVRRLGCDAGVVVTASHNPSKYNGYKAYDSTGCQLGPKAADYVLSIMNSVDTFNGVKKMDFDEGLACGRIEYIGEDVINGYLDEVERCRVTTDIDLSNLKLIYTPLNGAGNKPVRSILKRIGITDVTVVPEQEMPDGNFPTVPYPNPETRQAFECALEMAKELHPDLLLATDPDSDRVGIAGLVDGEYKLFSGNDVGVMLLNYMLESRKQLGTLPEHPLAVKTIVTTELCRKIAAAYNCELVEVLTGFKFIGEQITKLEEKGEENRYIIGFEESYGYLAGSHARDKDAVVASMLICEMTAYYKSIGLNLNQVLEGIYEKYGYCICRQQSFTCEGQAGMERIQGIMKSLRENPPKEIAGKRVRLLKDIGCSECVDFENGTTEEIKLPKSNVLCYYLEDESSFIVRPSGTEPKIKLYLGAVDKDLASAEAKLDLLLKAGTELLGF